MGIYFDDIPTKLSSALYLYFLKRQKELIALCGSLFFSTSVWNNGAFNYIDFQAGWLSVYVRAAGLKFPLFAALVR